MKPKLQLIISVTILANTLLAGVMLYSPAKVLAQSTNTPTNSSSIPTANNTPLIEYAGPENSIKRFLCVPNMSNPTGAGSTNDAPQGTIPGTNIPMPGTTTATSNPSAGDVSVCVNRLYRFAAVIGAFAAVFFVALAGYFYILGGEKAKEKAKHMIISVLVGLIIIFTAYILLKQINPEAVKFKTIQPPTLGNVAPFPECAALFGAAEQDCLIGGKVVTSNGSGGGFSYATCTGKYVPVTGLNSNSGLYICQDLLVKLQQTKVITDRSSIRWTVAHTTDNPEKHASSCHKTNKPTSGQCADIVVSGGKWGEFCSAAKSVGISILNEATATRGTSAESSCGKYTKTSLASASASNDHLHVYLGN